MYTSCETEKPFFQYMEQLENTYNDGHMSISGDTHLMKLAETKYEEMVENSKDTGVGEKQTDQITFLETQLRDLKEQMGTKQDNGSRTRGSRQGARKVPEWMTDLPKEGESKTKVVEDKTYHWCPGGQYKHRPHWEMHHPSDFKASKRGSEKEIPKEEPKPVKANQGENKVGWTTGMLALVHGAESD